MVKVIVYSSKEIYDNSSYEGRAEAHLIAYRDGYEYVIVKNRTSEVIFNERITYSALRFHIQRAEREEWNKDLAAHIRAESYKDHPYTTLMKNEQL